MRERSRSLTDAECALAETMFGNAIDFDRVRIHRTVWWPFQPRETLMAPDGDIWCHPQGKLYRACYSSADLRMQAIFIHEMTHVWQAQRRGRWYLPLMRHPFCRYAYTLKPGKRFTRYGIEQQAEIMTDAFLLRRGAVVRPGKPPLATYDALLARHFPFASAPASPTRLP